MICVLDAKTLNEAFFKSIQKINRDDMMKAYLASTFTNYVRKQPPEGSLTMNFLRAKERNEFEAYQEIGDWILWSGIFAHGSFVQHKTINLMFGKISYDFCHKMLFKKWPLYAELADDLANIILETRNIIYVDNYTGFGKITNV